MEKRLIVTPQDVMKITGRSDVWCERRLKLIKDVLGKEKHQFVTIKEFCDYEMFNIAEIKNFLGISN